jgi:hypothetical protein
VIDSRQLLFFCTSQLEVTEKNTKISLQLRWFGKVDFVLPGEVSSHQRSIMLLHAYITDTVYSLQLAALLIKIILSLSQPSGL